MIKPRIMSKDEYDHKDNKEPYYTYEKGIIQSKLDMIGVD